MFIDKLNGWATVPNEAMEFWIDDVLLPVTPHAITERNNNANESDQLVDGNPITIAKLDKAESFDVEFMVPLYGHLYINERWFFSKAKYHTYRDLKNFFKEIKQKREPVVITMFYADGIHFNDKFLLDTYSATQDANNGGDYQMSLSFTKYYPAENQELDIDLRNTLVRKGIRDARRVS